jgi:hypothetical protein
MFLGTPFLIRLMRRHGYGQPIRVEGLTIFYTAGPQI